jgi:phenylpropionate dioxygenase-like ring-hydroxylating dioxygenase large terminal subunit
MAIDNRPRSLRQAYSAYDYRAVPPEDAELTHVGPGTPCGEYFRRFWQPVALASELKDLPLRRKIMGEDLVIFRDKRGRVGVLQLHCSHRGTSLEYGLVSECGIRCCYHGWLFDVDGTILETPGEPPESTFKDRLFHGAYPTHEYRGLIFAYLGPTDRRPEFPIYDTYDLPGYDLVPARNVTVLPCNWLQLKENSMDPVHTAFLHTIVSGCQFTEAFGDVGVMEWQETPIGSIYIHTRRVGELVWVHMNDYISPNIHQFPPTYEEVREEKLYQRPHMTNWAVPIDDTTTLTLGFRHVPHHTHVDLERIMGGSGQRGARSYEERQRQPGDDEAQVSQRPIARHALEHLGATDRGITIFRGVLRRGIRAAQRGEDPPGLVRGSHAPIRTYSQDTILRIPPAPTPEADKLLLREEGRKVAADHYLKHPPPGVPSVAAPVLVG